jgi:hypothetical protein
VTLRIKLKSDSSSSPTEILGARERKLVRTASIADYIYVCEHVVKSEPTAGDGNGTSSLTSSVRTLTGSFGLLRQRSLRPTTHGTDIKEGDVIAW